MYIIVGTNLLKQWWDNHHDQGGSVWSVAYPATDNSEALELINSYVSIELDEVIAFSACDVFDNSMPNRDTLEDASKVIWLYNEINSSGLKFPGILLHEYWHDRYRVHPGSGRYLATTLTDNNIMPCVYYHYNEPGFVIPDNSKQILTLDEFVYYVGKGSQAHWEMYDIFSEDYKQKDPNWIPQIQTGRHWQMPWFSEGENFVNSKISWREYAVDSWYQAQNLLDTLK